MKIRWKPAKENVRSVRLWSSLLWEMVSLLALEPFETGMHSRVVVDFTLGYNLVPAKAWTRCYLTALSCLSCLRFPDMTFSWLPLLLTPPLVLQLAPLKFAAGLKDEVVQFSTHEHGWLSKSPPDWPELPGSPSIFTDQHVLLNVHFFLLILQ